MADEIMFSYVRTNKPKKEIERDGDYYLVDIGAFNAFNHSGQFYLLDGAKQLIQDKSSTFYRRLSNGYLQGEAGHPIYESGMSLTEYYERNLRLEQTRISHHIRDIILKETNTPNNMGSNIVRVLAWLRPTGPMGDALKKDLDDPDTNVAFSIRCFTEDKKVNGTIIKKVMQIVTWDWVNEPGIESANKFNTVSNEQYKNPYSLSNIGSIGVANLQAYLKANRRAAGASHESNNRLDMVTEMIERMNRNEVTKDYFKAW